MGLLQAGVDRAVSALWLGHESVETTQIYLEANLAMKEEILAKTTPLNGKPRRYRPRDGLLDAPLVATGTGVLIDKTSETMATVQDCGPVPWVETSTINRRQTQAHEFGKGCQPGSVAQEGDSGDHRPRIPRRRPHGHVDCFRVAGDLA
ncbi:MAG TPA: hypothetical protein VKU19_29290 [Bryobacteraceae bacterium]|nr:hypothetical protein [Bryobacteraceae bacterium]